ncbi:hypothetical protein ZIOFF_033983 [Zingiber officinale]|uniref:DUF4219 domain-containing protein n=1 Tax=Zingiber officinale TaxID=94328 RepID=A0A8J5GNQ4_ZINOF|nr:hypothetical protein ZIOFF_033983 [Zingiber officinale]
MELERQHNELQAKVDGTRQKWSDNTEKLRYRVVRQNPNFLPLVPTERIIRVFFGESLVPRVANTVLPAATQLTEKYNQGISYNQENAASRLPCDFMLGHETAPPAPLLPFSSEKGYAFSFDVLRTQTCRRCSAATVTEDRRHQPSRHLQQLLAREVVPTAESGKVVLQKLASAEGYVVLCLASVVVSDIDAGLFPHRENLQVVVSVLQKEMEASGSSFSSTTPPVFDGENYQAWAVKMSTFMEGSDLWEAVKDDYEVTPLPDNPTINQIRIHKESITRKAKAKSCLYAAVSPFIFNKIMKFPTAKDIWNFLKIEYEGDEKIRDRLINLANRIRVLSTDMKDDRIVQKILVALPERFEATIASLENTKDLSDIRLAELLSALEAQEQRRLMRREVPAEAMEGALPARSQMRASGREKMFWNQQKGNAEGSSSNKGHAEQRHLSESGSAYQRERRNILGKMLEGATNNEVELMFTASCFATGVTRRSWLVDSGCTHHMSYDEKSFANLDRSFCAKVKIGNGDYIDVEGRGDVVVDGLKGRKLISDVLYVPKIDQNLLSVGQLVQKGCKGQQAMVAQDNEAELWHRRLGHFHSKGIEFLQKNDMAVGFPIL